VTVAEFTFRQGSESDAFKILELFNHAFGKSRTIEQWRWRYLNGPIKKLLITVALDQMQRIIAHHALHPVWLVYKGKKVLGAQSIDAMVHTDFRGKGLFTETGRLCAQLAAARGAHILFAFQDRDSYSHRGFVNNLGWENLPEFYHLFYVLSPRRVLQQRVSNPLKRLLLTAPFSLYLKWKQRKRGFQERSNTSIEITAINKFDSSFDSLWEECKNQFAVGVWKDREYLHWRYKDVPNQNYTVLKSAEDGKTTGFIVTHSTTDRGLNIGVILDLLCREPIATNADALITAALSGFVRNSVDLVEVFSLLGSPYLNVFRSVGFFPRFSGKGNVVIAKLLAGSPGEQSIAHDKWHLMDGDSDIE
jgi:predicted N-acetyltransferase YhbS